MILRITCEADFRALCVLSCLSNENSFFSFFLVWPRPETAMGILRNCLVSALPYAHYVISFPLRGAQVLNSG